MDAGSTSQHGGGHRHHRHPVPPTPSSSTATVPATRPRPSASSSRPPPAPPGGTPSPPGQTITWAFSVKNTGNVTLTTVSVTDSTYSAFDPITCAGNLAPGATETCTATATPPRDPGHVDAGSTSNTAVATGTTANAGAPTPSTSTATVPASQTPSIGLVKSASPSPGGSYSAPGTVVTYTYEVTNTGNVTLTSVGGHRPHGRPSSPITCPVDLAPGATETCTATYTTTQADVDAGSINNTGTATGHPADGAARSPPHLVGARGTQTPAIAAHQVGHHQRPRAAPTSRRRARPSPGPSASRTPATSPSPRCR